MARYLIGIILFALVTLAGTESSYVESIEKWQAHRNAGLRKPDSWLTLVGLFWLNPGDNTIGSSHTNSFVLPKGSAPDKVGILRLEGQKVTFQAAGQSEWKTLSYDEDKPDILQAGSISFFAIQRGQRFAIRAKDQESPVLKHFTGVTFFPINPAFHFQARLLADPKKISILNVLGETEQQDSPGVVEFTYQGHSYHLHPIFEGDGADKTLFFLFKDPTSKTTTYQAGRMLNTPLPVNGMVDLDFNRAYNPPCTFTPFATCPLAPKENELAFPVEAGEKRYGNGHAELPVT